MLTGGLGFCEPARAASSSCGCTDDMLLSPSKLHRQMQQIIDMQQAATSANSADSGAGVWDSLIAKMKGLTLKGVVKLDSDNDGRPDVIGGGIALAILGSGYLIAKRVGVVKPKRRASAPWRASSPRTRRKTTRRRTTSRRRTGGYSRARGRSNYNRRRY